MPESCDVIIIGAGVVGCAIARELCRYQWREGKLPARPWAVLVLEKESDVAQGNSGKNSGVVHSGFNMPPGSLKARLNVQGARMFGDYCRELGVPYRRVGTLVVARQPEEIPELDKIMAVGRANGVQGLEIVDRLRLSEMEPLVSGLAAMWSPCGAIISPYGLNIALAENAMANGVNFKFNSKVTGISRRRNDFEVKTASGRYTGRYLINSAGLWSDKISQMAGVGGYRIYPCRGQYYIMDKRSGGLIRSMVYPVPMPGKGGLGIHLTPTIEGNILIGPSDEYIRRREDWRTTTETLRKLRREARAFLPEIDPRDFIAGYAGVRCKLTPPGVAAFADFVIREEPKLPGFINLVGIESPGLTSAPAIAGYVADILAKHAAAEPNPAFNPIRPPKPSFRDMTPEQRLALISRNPDWGRIICRCEQVNAAEVHEAMDNPLGARSLSGLKYRCRAGMGRCQGGFCLPKIAELWEKRFPDESPTLRGSGSELFIGGTKDLLRE